MPSNHHETFFHPMRALPRNIAPTSSNADDGEPQGSKRSCHTSHQSDTDHQPPGADLALSGSAYGRRKEGIAGDTKGGGRAPGAPMLRT